VYLIFTFDGNRNFGVIPLGIEKGVEEGWKQKHTAAGYVKRQKDEADYGYRLA
jgi:hypothetical protein